MDKNFSAKVIKHSISPDGISLKTMEIEYPRFILAELNTHRMLVKNSASSRAIPIKKMHSQILENTAEPHFWGADQPGMKASGEIDDIAGAQALWLEARDFCLDIASKLKDDKNSHKQITNRLTEPFMLMKTVISGTEWGNFFYLRDHPDAQPEFRHLAGLMKKAQSESTPTVLKHGEWHLPYVESSRDASGMLLYFDANGNQISLEDARIISAACCAQVSYRTLDDTLEKCKNIYSQLIESSPPHCSPVEHQATPIRLSPGMDEPGITHMTRDGMLWSGPLRGWIQFRKLIDNDCVW